MGFKKITEMTRDELSSFINNGITRIKDGLDIYQDYYTKKIDAFEGLLKNQDIDLEELRKHAYIIMDIIEHVEWSHNKQNLTDSSPNSIKPKRGEIWTCQLGKNIGSEENKIRPVIIIQNNTGNEKSPTTIIVPISNRPKKIAVHLELRRDDYDLVEGESEVKGTALCEQIKVVSKLRLGRHIATLKSEFITNILNAKLKNSIEIETVSEFV